MRSRPVCPAHSRHIAERANPDHGKKRGKKKRGRSGGWQGPVVRPGTAGEVATTTSQLLLPEGNTGAGEGWDRCG